MKRSQLYVPFAAGLLVSIALFTFMALRVGGLDLWNLLQSPGGNVAWKIWGHGGGIYFGLVMIIVNAAIYGLLFVVLAQLSKLFHRSRKRDIS